MNEEIKWTKAYMESLNDTLEAIGLPKFIIENGYAYKDDEIHKMLGVGIKLEEES